MNREEIVDLCNAWLPSWTGNDPELLISFYSEDAYYQDPANPSGLQGHGQILSYFKKLLAANPDWVWELVEAFPTELGFLGKWKATIPVGSEVITEYGVDLVEVEEGKITRNEVFFDRTNLLSALRK
ncbi:MAG TPA: nuclear transport factor 2 family protein [Candidatus Lokiarchaeia archaeon]|nr:nuclear transport factor 2 family protein [Candidatus Lokiarchaeia archaeon]